MMGHSEEMCFSFPQEKEVSSPEISQCSTMTQTLLSTDHSGAAKRGSLSFPSQGKNGYGASSTFFNQKKAMPTSLEISQFSTKTQKMPFIGMDKQPPGAALISDQGDIVSHSKVHKEEELRKSHICDICKKVFNRASTLNQHMIVHSGK